MVQYYTQEEAAKILGLDLAELKKMAERGELRAFRDRGTMRFRNQEVDELARRRGMGTNPALNLSSPPAAHLLPQPPPASPAPVAAVPAGAGEEDVFNFHVNPGQEEIDFGEDLMAGGSASAARLSKPSSRRLAASPKPVPGSDSEVRLVADGSQLDIHLAPSGGMPPPPASGAKAKSSLKKPSKLERPESKLDTTGTSPRPSRLRRPESHLDSGVRLVAPADESDSSARLSGDSGMQRPGSSGRLGKPRGDSVFRLEEPAPAPPSDSNRSKNQPVSDGSSTDEIDLDAELREAAKGGSSRSRGSKIKPRSGVQQSQFPVTSPFELSADEPGLRPVSKVSGLGSAPPASSAGRPSSKSGGASKVAPPADDEVNLGELHGGVMDSGINLQDPADSGISLEQQAATEEDDFELSLDAGLTPAPSSGAPKSASSQPKSDSDFELSLDAGMTPAPGPKSSSAPPPSDSDFELSLDAGMTPSPGPQSGAAPQSDSDFELSLDAGMTPKPSESVSLDDESDDFELSLDAGGATPRPSSSASVSDEGDSEFELTLDDSDSSMEELEETTEADQERDIFETDFDIPVLDDDSEGGLAAIDDDTDLASSDFDLDVEDDDGMSRSQVVALDDDEDAEVTADDDDADSNSQVMALGDEEDFDVDTSIEEDDDNIVPSDYDEEEEDDDALAPVATEARWGVVPALFLIPCVLVMFVVGLIGYESIRGVSGYRSPNSLTKIITGLFQGG